MGDSTPSVILVLSLIGWADLASTYLEMDVQALKAIGAAVFIGFLNASLPVVMWKIFP